jgi:hypothetical protein
LPALMRDAGGRDVAGLESSLDSYSDSCASFDNILHPK